MNIRGLSLKLRINPVLLKPIRFGFLLSTLLFVYLVYVIITPETINYPYNTYNGYPLTIYDNPYRISQSNCRNYSLVIIVHSAVTNFRKREVIRKTWGNKALLEKYGMKLVFVLGTPCKSDLQVLISEESDKHDDIVQGNFLDSYTNITHKAVLWLRWVNENCVHARTLLKLDDDVFVNVFLLQYYLHKFDTSKKQIWCEVKPAGEQPIQRRKGLKWRVEDHELRGLKYYPVAMCRGYFVILTIESIGPMYEAAKTTPFFWIDDFYIFGTLANKTGSEILPFVDYLAEEEDAFKCFTSTERSCHLLGVLLHSESAMEKLWTYSVDQVNSLS